MGVFEAADRSFPYFTWLRGTTPFTMWTRRQAHETAVHRVDAELAAGPVTPFPPEFAADGVDELLLDMVGSRRKALALDGPRTLHLAATDVPRTWTVVLAPEGLEVHGQRHGDGAGDCSVRATATALYRGVWHRGDADLDVHGDRSVLDAWWAHVKPAWS